MTARTKTANGLLTDFIGQTDFTTLPDAVIHEAKRALLDTCGCMLAGLTTPVGKCVVEMSKQFPQKEGASVVGTDDEVMPVMAAMANGFLANALDADDGHRGSSMHAGGVIFPAAFAAAQQSDCSGEDFITAVVLGYEIGLRAGRALNHGAIYFGSANGSTLGAAAAAGQLLNLNPAQMMDALGIAEIHAPTCQLMGWVEARRVPMIKEGMGWSAATGLAAALMAGHAISGTLTLFDPHMCYVGLDRLGEEYEILKRYYKPYPACRWAHAPLENFLKIKAEQRLNPDDIARVCVKTSQKASNLDNSKPPTLEDAQYSIPFVIGAAAVDGECGLQQMTAAKLQNPQILDMAAKVSVIYDPDMDANYPAFIMALVEVETTSGSVFQQTNELISGDWNQPMSDAMLTEKFLTFAAAAMGEANAVQFQRRVMNLETVASMDLLLKHLNRNSEH